MTYIKDAPTTLPAALKRIKELEQRVDDMTKSLDYGTVPAWLLKDLVEENERLTEELEACRQEGVDTQS